MRTSKAVSIQYLRGLAACLVVLHHARNPEPWLYDPLERFTAGQAGVDIFFVISGFVMYVSARGESVASFVRRRIARVVPMYWLLTLLTFAVLTRGAMLDPGFPLLRHLTLSAVFVPHHSLSHPDQIWPYLVPGWTLNFEMFFYAVFALGLAYGSVLAATVTIIALLVVAGIALPQGGAIWQTYTDPLLLEFLAGLLLGALRPRLASAWLIGLLPLGFAVMLGSDLFDLPRVIEWGLPAAMIVAGALAVEQAGRLPRLRGFGAIGDASYSIYLGQIIAITICAKLVKSAPLHGPVQFAAMVALSFAVAIGFGLLLYRLVERPLLKRIDGKGRRRPLPSATAARRPIRT